jgi:GNAT superfamily N-acetyltransferase
LVEMHSSEITVVPLRSADGTFAALLTDVDSILMRAYQMPSRLSRIERYLAIDELGFVVALVNEQLVGCGGVVAYPRASGAAAASPSFGWIGLIATDPASTGRGAARAVTNYLVAYLASRQCGAALDASTAGAPLYEKMGFADHGITAQFGYSGPIGSGRFTISDGCAAPTAHDLDAIVAFDAPRFGADRSGLLRYLWTECRGRWVVARNSKNELVGYGVAGQSTIGPIVCDEDKIARALITTLCTYEYETEPRMNVPHESRFTDVVSSLPNFAPMRGLRHQRFGIGDLPGQRGSLVAQCSFGEG